MRPNHTEDLDYIKIDVYGPNMDTYLVFFFLFLRGGSSNSGEIRNDFLKRVLNRQTDERENHLRVLRLSCSTLALKW